MIAHSPLLTLKKFFLEGNTRTIKAKKNIMASFAIKGLNIAVGLLLVPLTINYLNPTKYGIWITLSSIIAWFGFFDIGLGHGLRNRFAEAIANGRHELAQIYVSTTYAILSLVTVCALVLFTLINPLINWGRILNVSDDPTLQSEIELLALIVFSLFCIQFIFKLITSILQADQRPALASLFDLKSKIIILGVIYFLTKHTEGSLLYLGITASCTPVIVLFFSSLWFYNGKYKRYKPSWRLVHFAKASDLFNLGLKFFVLQITSILLYQTNNIIISHLYGPAEVTPYNIAFKYFSVLMMGFTIILTPFWSAFTEAWTKKEHEWAKRIILKLIQVWFLFCFAGILMVYISPAVYAYWVGSEINVHSNISLLTAIWVLTNAWNGIFSHFLNGVGIVKLQMYLAVGFAIINVPLSLFFGLRIGIEGILLANIIVTIVPAIVQSLQCFKLLNRSASGIWSK